MSKKNLTISLESQSLDWLRIESAKARKSVSKFLADLVASNMSKNLEYERAMNEYLSQSPFLNSAGLGKYPKRDELYEDI